MIQAGVPKRLVFAFGAVVVFLTILVLRHNSPHEVANARRRASASLSALDDINNATLGFEKVFVVGLPSRTDRRDGMVLQAALSNIDIDFIDGVKDSDIPEKAIPKAPENAHHIRGPALGSWRGHMNAIQQIVRQNLSSALVLEDDVDWDIRLRSQLRDFALSTHALVQPLWAAPGHFADATFPGRAEGAPSTALELDYEQLPPTVPPTTSPYGDGWDVLWIGHCGMHFPFEDGLVPKGRIIHREDVTVPKREHLWTLNIPFTLKDKYPEHTRAVHHVQEGVCSLGYAVSRAGARKILRHIALREASDAFDILLRFFCEGTRGRPHHICVTLQPALFHHHRPVGPNKEASDIGNHGDGFRTQAGTDMVRLSTRLNADILLSGGTTYIDQFPD
ncbi:glycosyltransferase family 25 (LPS biosynthesis protein) domain-containing protein [Hirsutella rhossiliensis]|uniref:Glycosyltransferase family 25 (LPS biosynthesis protein) domain-containing protein n=1 Tax=Hirsutella rhossiliensis TaxID=111463 RepID=A0A9P8SLH3_9HYPO|nr:glycosyltransferase family 25 (LPS biosynthesis protein) domain-containing protein [Hirsutella rhossiliensis]KAH0966259.1 glycosyltransferase family 25 (LPS biosynthesis protein) domain-containing protein [Hirsutella rhossiliensis]